MANGTHKAKPEPKNENAAAKQDQTADPAAQAAPGNGTALVEKGADKLPSIIDYGKDAGLGMEDMTREEFRIPLVRIIQKGSPQCKPVAQGGIEGAVAGTIFNTATAEMWKGTEPLVFIPCHRDRNYVEYVPRDAGGGFVGIHDPEAEMIVKLRTDQGRFGKLVTKDGTEIVETYYLYGLVITPDGEVQQDVLPFVSKQIAKYQSLMTRYLSITYPTTGGEKVRPPLFAHRWLLSTKFEQNKKGDWFGWVLRLEKPTPLESRLRLDDPLYVQAKGFYEMLKEGAAKADHTSDAKAGGAAGEEDKDLPF